jgi:ribosomal protein S18 acetylase RimI-like enzyme
MERVALRFPIDSLAEYLTKEPFLLAEDAGRLMGFLAFLAASPTDARLSAAGLSDDWSTAQWLDRMLPSCASHLRARDFASLSYVGSAAWLTGPLRERGFCLVSHIFAYEKSDWVIPRAGNQAVLVRPVQPADFPALVALDARTFHPLWRNSMDRLRRWQETLPYFVVAVAGEQPAGYCYCSVQEPAHGHLIRMAVHPAWQGQGIGTRLAAEALRFFRRAGVRRITLNTLEENQRAQRLYRQFGFRPVGREAMALWRDL